MADDVNIFNEVAPILGITQVTRAYFAGKLHGESGTIAASGDAVDAGIASHCIDDIATQETGSTSD
jgi:hypothetical protein